MDSNSVLDTVQNTVSTATTNVAPVTETNSIEAVTTSLSNITDSVITNSATVADRLYGLEAITQGEGWLVSATGMLIVFSALAGIAILLTFLPKFMDIVNKLVPESAGGHGGHGPKKQAPAQKNNDESIAVAIAVAHHKSLSK